MKKLVLIISFLLSLLAFFYFSPHFFKFEQYKNQITVEVSQALDMEIIIGDASLHWFPYPHLFISEVQATNEILSAKIPELRAIPDLKSLIHRKIVLGKIKLINPKIEIKKIQKESTPPELTLPDLDIDVEIENGSFFSPSWVLSNNISILENTFSQIDLNVTLQNNRIKYDFSAQSSFCDEITSTGRLDFNNFYYRTDFFYKKFNLCLLTDNIGDKTYAADQQNDFSAHLEGVTTKNFKLLLKGSIPTFYLKEVPTMSFENDSVAEITVEKYDDDFFLKIKDLQLNYPKINLNGKISRRDLPERTEPIWDLDLSGLNIDLNQSREFVLALFGENEIAKIVCDIVQGGRAKSARYTFNGTVSDFEYINKMQLWVDVEEASILIPDIDLYLDKAIGPISILDGVLSGDNLTAYIATSVGSNGSFLLDLQEDANAFQLDLDLDVDVQKLQEVLFNVVDEPHFQNELPHFKNLKGRAKGHLTLGESLHDIKTNVMVSEMQAEGTYDRIPWPFSIESGSLNVSPFLTEWDSVDVVLGPHHIFKNSGSISWEDQILMDIENIEADIDGESFFHEGTLLIGAERYAAKTFFSPILNELNGTIHATNGSISGLATSPRQWQYSADLTTEKVSLSSPHLPGKVTLQYASGILSDEALSLYTEATLLKESFQISIDYQHQDLTYWRGSSQFSGTINEHMITWLDSKKSIPPSYQIKTPLFADDIKIITEGNTLNSYKLSGRILVDSEDFGKTMLELDINRLENQFQNNIYFTSDKETGHLVYNAWDSPHKKTLMTWKGTLSSTTFDSFFDRHPFKSGSLKGVFTLLNTREDLDDASYSGYIEANNLQWETSKGVVPFTIESLLLSGNEDNIEISQSHFLFPKGDSTSLTGSIETDIEKFNLDLTLTSQELTSESLESLVTFFKQQDTKPALENTPEKNVATGNKKSIRSNISGKLRFSVDNFIHTTEKGSFQTEEEKSDPPAKDDESITNKSHETQMIYPWKGVAGEALLKNKKVEIDFSSAQLCGIDITGQWVSEDGNTSGTYLIDDTKLLNFQDTLPCLGFNQSIIEGDFSMKASLTGTPDSWEKGTLSLKSPSGIIRKMELLSKIFSVVNFTEFLTFRDLPDLKTQGLQYNDLVVESHVEKHKLIIDKAFLKGKGLNLTGQGSMDFEDAKANFTVFVAPFKMLDSVVTSIPLVGRIVGGKKGAILTFPVKVEGPLGDPAVTPLAPSAIGKATIDLITDTLTLPFAIFTPFTEAENIEPIEEKE